MSKLKINRYNRCECHATHKEKTIEDFFKYMNEEEILLLEGFNEKKYIIRSCDIESVEEID